jgi:CelD/BcsL family acetyltransferase involved in cellulose biosynthesis
MLETTDRPMNMRLCKTEPREPTLAPSEICRVLTPLRESWDAIPVPTPFQTYSWAYASAETFADGSPRVVTVGRPSPSGIAALCRPTSARRLTAVGAALYELEDFAYSDASVALELADGVLASGEHIFLRSLGADSPMLDGLRNACRGRRIMITRIRPGSPWVPLDSTWKEPEAKLNSGRRSDLRRAQRKANQMGDVRIRLMCPRPAEVPDLLDTAFRVEDANWKGRTTSSLASNAQIGRFYRHYAQAVSEHGALHLGFMWIGERAVAMQIAVKHANRYWLLKMGMDEEYARCSPGTLLMVESLRYAANVGYDAYEFQGVSEPWNQLWTRLTHDQVSVRVYAPGLQGLSTFLADGLKAIAQSSKHKAK